MAKALTLMVVLLTVTMVVHASYRIYPETVRPGDVAPGKVKDLWLLGLFPLQGNWPGGKGHLPAIEMALDAVNRNPSILPGYRLRMTIDDTKVRYCFFIVFVIHG